MLKVLIFQDFYSGYETLVFFVALYVLLVVVVELPIYHIDID